MVTTTKIQNYFEEIDRINERLFNTSSVQIQDRDSYDLAFNDLLSVNEKEITPKQNSFRANAFRDYVVDHPDVSTKRLFTRAKGKDLERDRRQTARRVVTTQKEFERETAPDVDLKGFDTARQKVSRRIRIQREFTTPARLKGKIVFTKKEFVTVKGKRQLRFRSPSGRFASGKAKG